MSSSLDDLDVDEYLSDEFYAEVFVDSPPEQQPDDELMYLHEEDRRAIAQTQPTEWKDCLISDPSVPSIFLLDESKKDAWKLCQEEVDHIRKSIPRLLQVEPNAPITLELIVKLAFGENSDFGTAFCNELNLGRKEFVSFIGNVCLQMSYHESPSSMYDEHSELLSSVIMKKDEYMNLWKRIATERRVTLDNYVGSSRRKECLWESMETSINLLLRKLTVAGRTDDIVIALDDDKIWVDTSGRNEEDDFGLRKVTHTQANRKGIIAHTAVSTTINIPLCFIFERRGDKAVECFTRLFGKLFTKNLGTLPDLHGVTNHSDRGYTLGNTIFDFLLPAGADFNNTCKRIAPFPFLWGMKPTTNDTRTILEEKGAPALFVKNIFKSGRLVTCAAFRTGTKNISSVVSSTKHGHQWEGICLNPSQRAMYEQDEQHGLNALHFKLLTGSKKLILKYKEKMEATLDDLSMQIDVITLEQGTADWHKARQFSLTSSQSDKSFRMAFLIFQEDDDWCNIAEYLDGSEYHTRKYYLI
jgi:hypothetical protein